MTNIAISALPVDASVIGPTDIFPVVTGGVTKSITASLLGVQGWTNKSVLFSNSSGNLSQDNANFSYDSTAHKLTVTNFQLGTSTTSGWVMTADASGNGTWVAPTGGVSSITGTANQVIASAATGAVTLSLPQSIATSSGVQFLNLALANGGPTTRNTLLVAGNCCIGWAGDPAAPADGGLLVAGKTIIGNTTADASAKLAVISTTKGFLPPVMSSVQRTAISATAGLMVFDNVLNDLYFYNGTTWIGHTSSTHTSIVGTANQVFANGTTGSGQTGVVTLTTPQDINTTSFPTFGGLTITSSSLTSMLNNSNQIGSLSTDYTENLSGLLLSLNLQNNMNVDSGRHCGTGNNYFCISSTSTFTLAGRIASGVASKAINNIGTLYIQNTYHANQWASISGVYAQNSYGILIDVDIGNFDVEPAHVNDFRPRTSYGIYASSPTQALNGNNICSYFDNTAIGYINTVPPSSGLIVQGKVGIGTNSPNSSAILDIESTTKGFLPPQGTTTQKNAIGSPAEGLNFYDLTLHNMQFYNGSSWISTGGVTSITGTANQIIASASTGAVTLSTPQDINTTSIPQFGGLKIGIATAPPVNGIIVSGSAIFELNIALGGHISGFAINTITVSADYTVLFTDTTIYVDTSGGSHTIRLPDCSFSSNVQDGKIFVIKDLTGNAPSNNITVEALGGSVFEGGVSDIAMTGAFEGIILQTRASTPGRYSTIAEYAP